MRQAMESAGRSVKTAESWRKSDPEWARQVDEARAAFKGRKAASSGDPVERAAAERARRDMSFEDFRKEFLGRETYDHHRAWICALEGRELDEGLPGELILSDPQRFILNTPPFHSKSMVITQEYVTYRICMDPSVRIIIVSKTQNQAKKFLYSVKQRLTDSRWAKLQAAFAPDGGFKRDGNTWSSTQIYVGQDVTSEEKDPTVEAIGIGSHVQGARADLIICDDIEDMHNSHLWEGHKEYIQDILQSRLYGGKLILVGTRAGVVDVYSELLNGNNYISGRSPWSQLRQPAVLAFDEDPERWKTLWPRASQPLDPESRDAKPGPDGFYPAWDGPALAKIRGSVSAQKWALLYQQEAVSAETVFKPDCVHGSVDRRRKPGPLTSGAWGHPRAGGEGMYTIGAVDPAAAGDTFVVVGKVDRVERKRWIENAFVFSDPNPQRLRDLMLKCTDEFGVNEWVFETNAWQLSFVHDPVIRTPLASRGVKLGPHYTSGNKQDPDFGVPSLAPLFGTTRRINDGAGREVHNDDNLIVLPDPDYSQGVATLIEELLTWVPGKRGKDHRMDGPMALWMWEMRARSVLGFGAGGDVKYTTHARNRFLSKRRAAKRTVVPAHLLEGGS